MNKTAIRKKITNPFYENVKKHGIRLKIDRLASTIPNRPPSNPYIGRLGPMYLIPPREGRPRRGEKREPTKTRSIRLAEKIWALADKQAKAEGLSTNAAIRTAIMIWLKS